MDGNVSQSADKAIRNVQLLLALNLAAHRKRLGLKQVELALKSGVACEIVSSIEKGACDPLIDEVGKLARGLDVPLFELFKPADPSEFSSSNDGLPGDKPRAGVRPR